MVTCPCTDIYMANKKLPLDPAIRAVYLIFLARVLYELILIEDDEA